MHGQTAVSPTADQALAPQSEEVAPLFIGARSVALIVIAVVVVLTPSTLRLPCSSRSRRPCSSACCWLRPCSSSKKLHIPRLLAAGLIVLATVSLIGAGITALAGPAQSWIEKGPDSLQKLEHRYFGGRRPLESIQKATDQLQEATQATSRAGPQEVRVVQPALTDLLLSGTPQAVASIFSVTILVYFLLASGDVFLRKLVAVIPTFHDKKRAVEITRQIETDISFYLRCGAQFRSLRRGLTSMAILAMVGIQTFDSLPQALAAPAILLVLVMISAEVITPFVLGRGVLLNPVAIFIAILLWGWLWGIVGVLLAVPLLASFKIVCERVEPLHPIAEFLTT